MPTPSIGRAAHDIDGSELEFQQGGIKPFNFRISYDAYPDATSASLILYADTGIIEVSDDAIIDLRASYACYDDPGPSYKPRAPKKSIAILPNSFNLSLGRWQESGSEIRVCAEVVYYNGTIVLGVERYMSVITVRD